MAIMNLLLYPTHPLPAPNGCRVTPFAATIAAADPLFRRRKNQLAQIACLTLTIWATFLTNFRYVAAVAAIKCRISTTCTFAIAVFAVFSAFCANRRNAP